MRSGFDGKRRDQPLEDRMSSMGMHAEDQDFDQVSDSKNRYIILLLVLTGVLMAVVDGSVVSIALPTITEYFDVSVAQSQMIMTSYMVTLTSLLMIFGKVAEYTGKAKLFLLGIALFTFSSLACGMSTSLNLLVLPELLSATISRVMILAGILCIIGTLVSIYRGLNSVKF
jgi:MFS family permease